MDTSNDIGNYLANWCNNSDAELSKSDVDSVVENRGECIPNEWSEKYQRDIGVVQIVVLFKLDWWSIKFRFCEKRHLTYGINAFGRSAIMSRRSHNHEHVPQMQRHSYPL
jgi:hypothetical protein